MSERFQIQNAPYQAWIAPDCSIQQHHPKVAGNKRARPFKKGDMVKWAQLCRGGYVYVCFGPMSTMYLYGRPEDLLRTKRQWMALGAAVERVQVTLIGEGSEPFEDAAAFVLPSDMAELDRFIAGGPH